MDIDIDIDENMNEFQNSLNTGPRGGVSIRSIKKNVPHKSISPPQQPQPIIKKKVSNIVEKINQKLLEKDSTDETESTISLEKENTNTEKSDNKKSFFNFNFDFDIKNKFFEYVKEIVLIVVLYIIISQPFIKNKLSEHFTIMENGNLIGIVIYGFIFAILYIIFKSILRA